MISVKREVNSSSCSEKLRYGDSPQDLAVLILFSFQMMFLLAGKEK